MTSEAPEVPEAPETTAALEAEEASEVPETLETPAADGDADVSESMATAIAELPVGPAADEADATDAASGEDGRTSSIPFAPLFISLFRKAGRRRMVAEEDDEAEATPVARDEMPSVPLLSAKGLQVWLRRLKDNLGTIGHKRTVTLSVENGVVRALVTQGREVLAWGSSDPDEGLEFEEEEFGRREADEMGRAKEMLDGLRLQRAGLVTDLPPYSALLRQFSLPSVGRRYLESVAMSEVVDSIPFRQEEVDIKWRVVKSKPEQIVSAVIVQKALIDESVDRYRNAGIRVPTATYSKASALAAAARFPDAIVLHMHGDQAAIILVRDSTPQAVHQVSLAEQADQPEEQADALSRAIIQIIGYDRTLGDGETDKRLPIVITGRPPDDGRLQSELEELLGQQILPLSPDIDVADDFPIQEFAANVGMAILDRAGAGFLPFGSAGPAAAQNLLSERHVPNRIPLKQIAVFLALGAFALASVALSSRAEAQVDEVARVETVLPLTVDRARVITNLTNGARGLQNKIRATKKATLALESQLDELEQDVTEQINSLATWYNRIETITVASKPPGVTVGSFKPDGNRFVLVGTATTVEGAIEYATRIRETDLFTEVRLTEVAVDIRLAGLPGGPSGSPEQSQPVSFKINATLVP